jgi:hypothetical protein
VSDALGLVVLAVLKARVAAADKALREQVCAALKPGETRVAEIDGREVGTVQYARGSKGSTTASVTNETALLHWCRDHAQHLITETVNSASQKALLEAAKDGGWPDEKTGEMLPIPGITVTPATAGSPVLRVKLGDGAQAAVESAMASHGLAEYLALPGAA